MILEMIDPNNYNNNALKDEFLGNMYRIVRLFLSKNFTFNFHFNFHLNFLFLIGRSEIIFKVRFLFRKNFPF